MLAADNSSRALGNAGGRPVAVGRPNSTTAGHGPLSGTTANRNDGKAIYALSGVFRVALEATVPRNWALIPEGLSAGDKFRLLFATSTTRNAASTAIADYNSFVQARAAAGHSAIQGYSAGFRVVASTAAVDARDNTETTYTNSDRGPPIYWLDGAKVADDYGAFYDGAWDDEAGSKDESGTARPLSGDANLPFTGSGNDGTEDFESGSSVGLGETEFGARIGKPNDAGLGATPLSSRSTGSTTSERPFYALSPVFTVGEGVGVPADWSLKPADVAAGNSFRLLFVTHIGHAPTSTDIADYNTYIQSQANAGSALAAIRPYSSGFRVVGSTAAVDARDNTATKGTGVPIYWLNGSKVADNYADFYDGSWDDEANARRRDGSRTSPNYVFTGSAHNGTEARGSGTSLAFGRSSVRLGQLNTGSAGPLTSVGVIARTSTAFPYYALSAVFTAETLVAAGTNTAPAFTDIAPAARSVAENSAAGRNVGLPVAATDGNGDSLTYSLGGADAASFEIVSTSGQIRTKAGVTYDYETKPSYSVLVSVTDNTYTDSIAVTITLTDVLERPAKPDAPVVSASPGTTDTLSVSWTAPEEFGKEITDYDLRYRAGGSSAWIDFDHTGAGLAAAITGLAAGTAYEVQVRATNEDGARRLVGLGPGRDGHPAGGLPGLEPPPRRPDGRRPVPAAVRHLHHPRRHLHQHRRLQQLRADRGRGRPCRHPGLQLRLHRRRQHRRRRRPRQHPHHLHQQRQGRPHLLAGRGQGRRRVRGFLRRGLGRRDRLQGRVGDARSLSGGADLPFTGSDDDGTGDRLTAGVCCDLGSSSVRVGIPGLPSSVNNPLSSSTGRSRDDSRPFYALSPVFVVGPGITVPPNWDLSPTASKPATRSGCCSPHPPPATPAPPTSATTTTTSRTSPPPATPPSSPTAPASASSAAPPPTTPATTPATTYTATDKGFPSTGWAATRSPTTTRTSTTRLGTTRPIPPTSPATPARSPASTTTPTPAATTTEPRTPPGRSAPEKCESPGRTQLTRDTAP